MVYWSLENGLGGEVKGELVLKMGDELRLVHDLIFRNKVEAVDGAGVGVEIIGGKVGRRWRQSVVERVDGKGGVVLRGDDGFDGSCIEERRV